MGATYPYRLRIPAAEPMFSTRPTMGDSLGGLAHGLNHMAGLRGRGFHMCTVGRLAWAAGYHADLGFPPTSENLSEKHRLILRTSPISKHVAVSIWLACNSEEGTGAQSVTASLLTMSGGPVDPGVVWSRENGHLHGEEHPQDRITHTPGVFPLFLTTTYKRLKTQQIQTAGTARDGLVAGGVPTAPRLLSLEGKAGDDLELLVEAESVYVLGFAAFEWPETTLD